MFTEGLDERAVNWVNQGSDEMDTRVRSAVTEQLAFPMPLVEPFPKSPLTFLRNSSHLLPPLKFHSGLLATGNLDTNEEGVDDNESVASVSYEGALTEEEEWSNMEEDSFRRIDANCCRAMEMGELGNRRNLVKLNKGLIPEDLNIEIPNSLRRLTSISNNYARDLPSSRERTNLRNELEDAYRKENLGTPSAPPIAEFDEFARDFRRENTITVECEGDENCNSKESQACSGINDFSEQSFKPMEIHRHAERHSTVTKGPDEKVSYPETNSMDKTSYYSTNGHYAWQTFISYDACIRLCLYAWSQGCQEAPEFLKDECLVLRSAFGLHKFLLQPCGLQQNDSRGKIIEQTCHLKTKKNVEKIKVEVLKLRILPKRKLKRIHSRRSSMYIQMGKEYIQHISSLLKSGISSLNVSSFSMHFEEAERMSPMIQLKSASEDTQTEFKSNICLRPGTGDCQVFYPESEGDALLVEIQDDKGVVQGRTTIPISSLNDNPGERTRWWPLYLDDQECVGKIQLFIGITIGSDDTINIKSGAGPVVETLAYDLLLEAALRSQNFHSRNLKLDGPWMWLLTEFGRYYGVSDIYAKLRYLSHVMSVATSTRVCLELVEELLVPIIKAKNEKILTRQEKCVLLDCETRIDCLLATTFENYRSLDENSTTGILDNFGTCSDPAASALAPAVKVYTLFHDILSQEAQNLLRNYIQTAIKKRCRKHMIETDEFVTANSDGFLLDSSKSMAYKKMKNLCSYIAKEIHEDIKLHNQHVLPSSIDLSSMSAVIYSTELCKRARGFLSAWPPSGPQPCVNEFLTAISDFERELEKLHIGPVAGGVDSRMLFHDYIMVWVQDMQLSLQEICKAEKAPWTNHSTALFAEEMYDKIKEYLIGYEVVINRWPQYSLILENAVADIERTILKSLEKQYIDVLTPLKDSIPKKLNKHVQKLTRRQSTTLYAVPIQLGTFLNTVKRIVDVLHIRVEGILKSWAAYLPIVGDKKSAFGEQMNGVTVLLRTKYKNYLQAIVEKLVSNTQAANRNTRLKRILEEMKEEDGEAEIRERMQLLNSHIVDSVSNLHDVFSSMIFVAACRGFWDRMGQIVLRFLESRKENKVWYNGSCYVLGILDDTFASQMQRLLGNSLQEKDLEPPTSVTEARSILCRDITNASGDSSYFYV